MFSCEFYSTAYIITFFLIEWVIAIWRNGNETEKSRYIGIMGEHIPQRSLIKRGTKVIMKLLAHRWSIKGHDETYLIEIMPLSSMSCELVWVNFVELVNKVSTSIAMYMEPVDIRLKDFDDEMWVRCPAFSSSNVIIM